MPEPPILPPQEAGLEFRALPSLRRITAGAAEVANVPLVEDRQRVSGQEKPWAKIGVFPVHEVTRIEEAVELT